MARHLLRPAPWSSWNEEQREYLDDVGRRAGMPRSDGVDLRRSWRAAHRAGDGDTDVVAPRPITDHPAWRRNLTAVGPTASPNKEMHMEELTLDENAHALLERLRSISDTTTSIVAGEGDATFVVTALDTGQPDAPYISWFVTVHPDFEVEVEGVGDHLIRDVITNEVGVWKADRFIPSEAHLIRWSDGIGQDIGAPRYIYAERYGHPANRVWLCGGERVEEQELVRNDIRFNPIAVLLTTEQEFMRVNGNGDKK